MTIYEKPLRFNPTNGPARTASLHHPLPILRRRRRHPLPRPPAPSPHRSPAAFSPSSRRLSSSALPDPNEGGRGGEIKRKGIPFSAKRSICRHQCGAVAPRPGGPERAAASGRRRLLDPLPRPPPRLRIHGGVAGLRRAPPPAGGALRVVQGRVPPRPPRPAPPIPDLQPAVDELAALIRSGLAGLVSAFRRVAQGQAGSGRVFACLAAAALLGRLTRDLPTLCYAVVVHEVGVSEPVQIRALLPELLPHLVPPSQGLPHRAAQGTSSSSTTLMSVPTAAAEAGARGRSSATSAATSSGSGGNSTSGEEGATPPAPWAAESRR